MRVVLLLPLALAACATPAVEAPPRAVVRAPAALPPTGGAVLGQSARWLQGEFGQPAATYREGEGERLQWVTPVCVLDAYLYPPATGGAPAVTHLDTRLPSGAEVDEASCVAALRAERARK